jgi:hypothetical protein
MFKATFHVVQNVVDFINNFLPHEIASQINTEALELENTTYITRGFRGQYSDIVYKTNWRGTSKNIIIAILFEHKVEAYDNISAKGRS